jgi:MFS family permease
VAARVSPVGAGKVAGWLRNYRSALAVRDLRLLFTGLFVSATGSWAYNVGLLALVYERTHSLAWIGAATLARFVPSLIASPYGGVIAERTERIRLMIVADVLCAVWQVGLVLVAISGAPITIALVLSAMTSVTNVVYSPAVAATIPAMVTESDLVAANALNGTIDNLVVILGPAVGAVLLLVGSTTWTFAINAASFAVSALIVSRIRTRSRPVDVSEEGTAGPLRQVLVGVRTIVRNESALPLVGLCALASFLYGTDTVLFVAVSQHRLGTGAQGFGYLLAGLGIGGLLMAPWMDRLGKSANLAPIILAGISLYCLPTAVLAFTHNAALVFVIQIVRGAATLIVDVMAITSLQRTAPSEELARVFGVFFAIVLGAICLGALITPQIVSAVGLSPALFTMAVAPFALGLLGYMSLRRIDLAASIQAKALAPRVALLEQLDMFASASRLVLERLAAAECELDFDASTPIVVEGDPSDAMYVLIAGQVEVRSRGDEGGPERLICTLQAPAFFGEIGVLGHLPRTATVTALSDCQCARIEGPALFEALNATGPSSSLMDIATSRLRVTYPSRELTYASEAVES